jgi:hypothetical protein
MKQVLISVVLLLVSFSAYPQKNQDTDEYDENYEFPENKQVGVSLGLGLGIDYGGIGGKFTFAPAKHFVLFAAVGYNFNNAGFNGGMIFRMAPEKKVSPFATVMYGYNAVIVVQGVEQANKTYYGPTFGFGIELKAKSNNFWNFGVNIPVRSGEYKDDFDALDRNPDIDMTAPFPVAISVGYHFAL